MSDLQNNRKEHFLKSLAITVAPFVIIPALPALTFVGFAAGVTYYALKNRANPVTATKDVALISLRLWFKSARNVAQTFLTVADRVLNDPKEKAGAAPVAATEKPSALTDATSKPGFNASASPATVETEPPAPTPKAENNGLNI